MQTHTYNEWCHRLGEIRFTASARESGSIAIGSPEFDLRWLPILGPTATAMARLVAQGMTAAPVIETNVSDLARALGVKPLVVQKTLMRLAQFGVIEPTGPDEAFLFLMVGPPKSATTRRYEERADERVGRHLRASSR